jgi:deoxyribodipyrimidine photo-lyase
VAWREFYADVLWHRPDSAWTSLSPVGAHLRSDTGPDADARFEAWTRGRTGYPLVDAGMRQLLAEGWMHNRVRMLVASFLVKDLHLAWQRGAAHFLDLLIDGDLASNNHGWQWVAGTGTDAAPFYRIFSPERQAERFDPDGAYVTRYVPEFGTSAYPGPIVDHAVERVEALARWEEAKEAAGAGPATGS